MQKQLIALLEVVKQVAQTSMIDFCVADRDSPARLQGLLQAEQFSLKWLIEQVILAERVVIVPNVRELPQVEKFLGQRGVPPSPETIHFYAGFPVRRQQQIVGVLSVMARCHHALSPNQQSAIATLGAAHPRRHPRGDRARAEDSRVDLVNRRFQGETPRFSKMFMARVAYCQEDWYRTP